MEYKTTDGYEVKKGYQYFLVNGQVVTLAEMAIGENNIAYFVVIPFYEGETLTVNGNGGTHNEINAYYEHEGLPILVREIYNKAPLEKLDPEYKKNQTEITQMGIAIGELKQNISTLKTQKNDAEKLTKNSEKALFTITNQVNEAKSELDNLNDNIITSRQKLSELQDGISRNFQNGPLTTINVDELQQLKKDQFKLQCLENGGVDNWEWYSESLTDYFDRYPKD
jgi:hypothetical protein